MVNIQCMVKDHIHCFAVVYNPLMNGKPDTNWYIFKRLVIKKSRYFLQLKKKHGMFSSVVKAEPFL